MLLSSDEKVEINLEMPIDSRLIMVISFALRQSHTRTSFSDERATLRRPDMIFTIIFESRCSIGRINFFNLGLFSKWVRPSESECAQSWAEEKPISNTRPEAVSTRVYDKLENETSLTTSSIRSTLETVATFCKDLLWWQLWNWFWPHMYTIPSVVTSAEFWAPMKSLWKVVGIEINLGASWHASRLVSS